jgi:hypothetical protein
MPNCSICSGPIERLNAINALLQKKTSFKQIAATIGDVSKASIGRHSLKCVTRSKKGSVKSIRQQVPIILWPDGSAFIRRDYGSSGHSITPVTLEQVRALPDDEYCVWCVQYEKPSDEALANIANAAQREADLAAIAANQQSSIIAIEPDPTPPEIPPAT